MTNTTTACCALHDLGKNTICNSPDIAYVSKCEQFGCAPHIEEDIEYFTIHQYEGFQCSFCRAPMNTVDDMKAHWRLINVN